MPWQIYPTSLGKIFFAAAGTQGGEDCAHEEPGRHGSERQVERGREEFVYSFLVEAVVKLDGGSFCWRPRHCGEASAQRFGRLTSSEAAKARRHGAAGRAEAMLTSSDDFLKGGLTRFRSADSLGVRRGSSDGAERRSAEADANVRHHSSTFVLG